MKILRLLFPLALGVGFSLAFLLLLPWHKGLALGGDASAEVEAAVRYVAKSGLDQGDCAQPEAPCRTIQYAIDQAEAGDEVRIAGGVYTDVNGYAGLAQIAYISKTLDLRGGYTLTNWITPDVPIHPTVLDAHGLGRGVYITGPITTTLEGLRVMYGNSKAIESEQGGGLYASGASITLRECEIISSTTGGGIFLKDITPGMILTNTISGNYGGGVVIIGQETDLLIRGNTIRENKGSNIGGGIYAGGGQVEITSNQIISNTVNQSGGGVYGIVQEFNDNLVAKNHASWDGGGAWIASRPEDDPVEISKNTFLSNTTAHGYGGGLLYSYGNVEIISNTFALNDSAFGGGLYIDNGNASMTENNLTENLADFGAGIYVYSSTVQIWSNAFNQNKASRLFYGENDGGGLYSWHSTISLGDNLFRGNESEVGGGMYLYYSDVELSGNTIVMNTSRRMGAGAYLLDSPAVIDNNIIAENITNYHPGGWGGGMVLDGSSANMTNNLIVDNQSANLASGLLLDRVDEANLIHNTFARNDGGAGDAIFMASDSHLFMTNTIIVSQTIGIDVGGSSSAVLEGTLWGSGEWANGSDWIADGEISTGTVNIWGDPRFIDPNAADFHLGFGSAAIDAGVDSGVLTDIDGQPRPAGNGFDIGADESWLTWWAEYFPLLMR